jgi:predicted nucleotidyltransferase
LEGPLERAVKSIIEAVEPDQIILFGSRAQGVPREESDYDLFVLKKVVEHKRKLAQQIYRSLYGVGVSVDVIVETPERFMTLKDNPFLIYKEIAENGRIIYEKPGTGRRVAEKSKKQPGKGKSRKNL